jgi:hypothetical protein
MKFHSNNPLSTMAPPVFEKITLTKGVKEDDIAINLLALLTRRKETSTKARQTK